jgi:hypothetical protein
MLRGACAGASCNAADSDPRTSSGADARCEAGNRFGPAANRQATIAMAPPAATLFQTRSFDGRFMCISWVPPQYRGRRLYRNPEAGCDCDLRVSHRVQPRPSECRASSARRAWVPLWNSGFGTRCLGAAHERRSDCSGKPCRPADPVHTERRASRWWADAPAACRLLVLAPRGTARTFVEQSERPATMTLCVAVRWRNHSVLLPDHDVHALAGGMGGAVKSARPGGGPPLAIG